MRVRAGKHCRRAFRRDRTGRLFEMFYCCRSFVPQLTISCDSTSMLAWTAQTIHNERTRPGMKSLVVLALGVALLLIFWLVSAVRSSHATIADAIFFDDFT